MRVLSSAVINNLKILTLRDFQIKMVLKILRNKNWRLLVWNLTSLLDEIFPFPSIYFTQPRGHLKEKKLLYSLN